MTSELLALRRETSAAGGSSQGMKAVERIDGMLATLGVRVVRRAQPEPAEGTSDSLFNVNPGEAVEFETGTERETG